MDRSISEDSDSNLRKTIVEAESSQSSQKIIHHHYTTQQDSSTFSTSVVLNEPNYNLWAPLMQMQIGARGKVGYLTGAKEEPAKNSAVYEA